LAFLVLLSGMPFDLGRRAFIRGLAIAVAAPAIVRASSLMAIDSGPLVYAPRTFWLARDGSDLNPGTYDRPFGSIARAMAQLVRAGDTLIVKPGRYSDAAFGATFARPGARIDLAHRWT
jgi:hypothetical protein